MKYYSFTLLACVLLLVTSISQAEVISIADPTHQVANSSEGVLRPVRGMSMDLVTQKFGQPEQKTSAVGQPPISRWIYQDFVVFFESNIVIDSVVPHHQ
ncbi:hypothetical protein LCGC14_1372750 [marine sediment metagenome]|uniref:Lipoprotein SmpA/OmlA domain-containing protein n=1 Tax=marine sediment metagenome TaxID=412755 RepID=A0A0F9MK69_9ZZZZ|nr:hypothetical protein [Methylophaga sp.]HEC58512.1 hypothetical protein [Methylophaga sp.]